MGSSVTVRLQNMSQEHFLSPLLGTFLEGVSAVLSVPVEDVFIFNIQPDLDAAPGGILNVSFSAALPGGHFFPSEALEEQLYLNRPRLTSLTQMEVSPCAKRHTQRNHTSECLTLTPSSHHKGKNVGKHHLTLSYGVSLVQSMVFLLY